MADALYITKDIALINYTQRFYSSSEELVSSSAFDIFLDAFFEYYKDAQPGLYHWITKGSSGKELNENIKSLLKMLLVMNLDEIENEDFDSREKLLKVVEDAYLFWRNKSRFSIISTTKRHGLQMANFIESDVKYNQIVLNLYRTVQQKVEGVKNRVYRQLQAGTNASLVVRNYKWDTVNTYEPLKNIPFINMIMLRTPLIIHTKSNKRVGTFTETDICPMKQFRVLKKHDWYCFPCKVGGLLTFFYYHRDFSASAVALSNLFELASENECQNQKPDCIVLFGNQDDKDDTVFYHDKENDVFVGKVSYNEVIHYFGYAKKMCLTLHNLAMMKRGGLPLHGAMINLHLKDGSTKGVVFIGDSGAGKSETIEALAKVAVDEIVSSEIVFDDMGTMILEDGKLSAMGTEIGAFVRLDDLDKGTAYRDIDRSIFFNPESSNARVVIPATNYKNIVTKHPIDMVLYANNYDDKRGLAQITDLNLAKKVFLEGKRFALGTTQENGISTTFFANPFGPMQKQEECLEIFNTMFDTLFTQNVFVGEVYTCLGLPDKGEDGIKIAAQELLNRII